MSKDKVKQKTIAEEKQDGLEITSIGSIYSGPWDKKYWSCSRGKDRYPYPVGYEAVRAHNGITCKMEIHEGSKGPLFVITSVDGQSFSGQTPDIAWEKFQRKGCLSMKIWHGKRFSCKIDGVEFFGFKNTFVQRLLRELVANVNGTTELKTSSPNLFSGHSGTEQAHQHADACTNPDLLTNLVSPQVMGKRSRTHEMKNNTKSVNEENFKELRNRDLKISFEAPKPFLINESKESSMLPAIKDDIGEQPGALFPVMHAASVAGEDNTHLSSSDASPYDSYRQKAILAQDVKEHLGSENNSHMPVANNLSMNAEPPDDRSLNSEAREFNLTMESEDTITDPLDPKNNDIHLCAPDTLDMIRDAVISDSAPVTLDRRTYKRKDELAADMVRSKVLEIEAHPEEEIGTLHLNSSSERSDFDSVGQETAKSMMTYLLPQAIPLLKKASTKKKAIVTPVEPLPCGIQFQEEKNEIACSSTAMMLTKNSNTDGQEDVRTECADYNSTVPTFELAQAIIHDSFEDSQCSDHVSGKAVLTSDITEAATLGENNSDKRCMLNAAKPPQDQIVADIEDAETITVPVAQVPIRVYTRKKARRVSHLTTQQNDPTSENTVARNHGDCLALGTSPSNVSLHASEIYNINFLPEKEQGRDVITAESKLGRKGNGLHKEIKTTMKYEGARDSCSPTLDDEHALISTYKDEDFPGMLFTSALRTEKCEPCVDKEVAQCENLSEAHSCRSLHAKDIIFSGNHACNANATELGNISDINQDCAVELYSELEGMVLLGCYLHRMPVLSVLLSKNANALVIYAVCGLMVDRYRTILTYKVELNGPRKGHPSFVSHTSVRLPILKDHFGREIALERSGFQLTPDGECLVMLNSIRTPHCRDGRTDCSCSTCNSDYFEEDNVKIVQVELGYVSVVAKLKTVGCVHCLLVCKPNHLVAVGDSGRLHVWVMNSCWSAQSESYMLPSNDCTSPGIVELKRIPNNADLLVGHNGFGEFSIWDVSERAMMSKFSSSSTSVCQFFPIGLFRWPRNSRHFNYGIKEHVSEMIAATNKWFYKNTEKHILQLNGEDVAIWLFVSTALNSDAANDHDSIDCQINRAGLWRLALLTSSMVSFGAALDSRASAIGALAGQGIIGTREGHVYMWELSSGTKLGTLLSFKGTSVSCIATDEKSGAVAVASDRKLLVYLQS